MDEIEDKPLFKKFVNNYLREDGVLALRILSRNSQDLIVSEAVANLYNSFKSQYKKKNLRQIHLKNMTSYYDDSAESNIVNEIKRDAKNIENSILPPQIGIKYSNAKGTEA
jgi:hypothetical protein